MSKDMLILADDPVTILRACAKAYRETPECRFPSDPHAEFFPADLEAAADEIKRLRTLSDQPGEAVAWREALHKIINLDTRVSDGGKVHDHGPCAEIAIRALASSPPVAGERAVQATTEQVQGQCDHLTAGHTPLPWKIGDRTPYVGDAWRRIANEDPPLPWLLESLRSIAREASKNEPLIENPSDHICWLAADLIESALPASAPQEDRT